MAGNEDVKAFMDLVDPDGSIRAEIDDRLIEHSGAAVIVSQQAARKLPEMQEMIRSIPGLDLVCASAAAELGSRWGLSADRLNELITFGKLMMALGAVVQEDQDHQAAQARDWPEDRSDG